MTETLTIYEMIMEFVKPELFILIPVIYLLGIGLKRSSVPDSTIPFKLGGISILLCLMYIIATSVFSSYRDVFMAVFVGVTQGILCAGASVYFNQLIKQFKKGD